MPAKKAPKKTAAKKKAAKKPATKKAAAKKTAPRKGTAKKAAAKKAAPKKAAAKKAAPKKSATRKATGKKAAPKKKGGRGPTPSSPELNDVACQLASLALAKEKSPLSVRQVEQLRRALATAGDALGWIENLSEKGESMAQFSRDMMAMAKSGAKSHGKDLAEQLASKKTEVAQLNEVIEYARELAEDSKTEYPVDITFAHTIRDAYQSYVTKTETRVANDADEARAAAAAIERSLTSWTKLADAMVEDLKKRQKEMAQVPEFLPDFVASSRGLIGEVVANLE